MNDAQSFDAAMVTSAGLDLPVGALEGTLAVISGGSRGIGLAAASGIARLGATVVLLGKDGERTAAAAGALVEQGLDAVGLSCDVADADSVARLQDALGRHGEPDVLVCSAGVMALPTAKTLRADDAEWDRVMGTNFDGVRRLVRLFGPGMAARRKGRIIAVSACMGRMSGPGTHGGFAPYRISKAAVNAFVKNLAAETGQGSRGLFVDAMCPAHCRTDMGGADAPRSADQGADTIVWLAARTATAEAPLKTGLLWEDRAVVPW